MKLHKTNNVPAKLVMNAMLGCVSAQVCCGGVEGENPKGTNARWLSVVGRQTGRKNSFYSLRTQVSLIS